MEAEKTFRKYIPEPTNEGERNDDINIVKAMEDYAEAYRKWCFRWC